MTSRAGRRASALLLLLAGLFMALAAPARAQDGALVDVVQIKGVLDAPTAAYLRDVIAKANADGADLVAIELDTPGGLNVSIDDLVGPIARSEVPVLTFVPTSGRAASAGTVLAYGSHLLAASPVSRLGAAEPVDLGGASDPDATAARLVELAEQRGRNAEFAEAAVRDRRVLTVLPPGGGPGDVPEGVVTESDDVVALTAEEAVGGGYVDLVEPELVAVLERLSGYEVAIEGADGVAETRTLDIDGATAQLRFNNPGLLRRVLSAVSDPTLAYLLLMAGALAIAFEVFQPGFGVAGLAGIGLAALGVFGLAALPVSWLGFALVAVGFVLLTVDLAIAGLGPLTLSGTLALGVGSFLLFDGPPVLRVPAWIIVAVVAFAVLFFVVIMTTVLRAQGAQANAGAQAVIGTTGIVRSVLNPEGHIFAQGALWRARAPESAGRVRTGTVVRVLALDDSLTLEVEPVDERQDTPVS